MLIAETIVTSVGIETPIGGLTPRAGTTVIGYNPPVDPEAQARAIAEAAKQGRRPTPRWLWITALVVAAVCFGGLAIAWLEDRDTVATNALPQRAPAEVGGFGTGIVLGIGIGAVATSAVLLRRR